MSARSCMNAAMLSDGEVSAADVGAADVAGVDPEAALVGGSEGEAPVVDAADAGGRSGVSVDEESGCHEIERVL